MNIEKQRMQRINKLDPFKKNLYAEFESNSFKLLGVPSSRVREVLGERGHDLNAEFEAAFDFAGIAFMRQKMSMTLARLELVYYETKIGRQLTDEEQTERYTAWDIGLNAKTIDEYYLKKQEQDEAAEQQ